MRYLFPVLLLLIILNTHAADTLTRAQVYNFAVGDTFDYRITVHTYTNPMGAGEVDNTTISYTRFKITQIYWSLDSLAKYIVRQQLYPLGGYDTTVLTNLTGYEVIMDTTWYNSNFANNFFVVDTSPSYFGQTTNEISFFCCAPGWDVIFFGRGLGRVLENTYGGTLSNHYNDTTLLIYYSGANGVYGQRFTSFPTGESELSSPAKYFISISPDPNAGKFLLQLVGEQPYWFALYDLTGRQVLNVFIDDNSRQIDLNSGSAGLYFWKAVFKGSQTLSGKMVVE